MLREFALLVADLFPSLDSPNAREYLNKIWKKDPPWLELYATQFPLKLCQGDIVNPVTFIVEDEQGDFGELVAPGMILSHSCDIDEDDNITLAACRPFDRFKTHRSVGDIKNNTFFGAFYLRSVPSLGDQVVDFSILQSVRTKRLAQAIPDGAVTRVMSFSDLGYYFLIAKLTVRFLRPQSAEEVRGSSRATFAKRFRYALLEVASAGRYVLHGSEKH